MLLQLQINNIDISKYVGPQDPLHKPFTLGAPRVALSAPVRT